MSGMRVINLGLPKCGTTTLARALRRAGMRVADWKIRKVQTEDVSLHGRLVGELIYESYFTSGDPLDQLTDFQAISEMSSMSPGQNYWPQTDWSLLNAILTHHPDVKILLSYRDPQGAAHSMLRWNSLGKRRLPKQYVPGLPRGFGATAEELAHWIEGHYAFCRHVFAGSDRFLEYDITDPDAPVKIGAFLGQDLPWWGQLNRNKSEPATDVAEVTP